MLGVGGKQGSAQRNLGHRKALETVWRLKCQQCLGTASRTRWRGAGKRPEGWDEGPRIRTRGWGGGGVGAAAGVAVGGHWGHLAAAGEIT